MTLLTLMFVFALALVSVFVMLPVRRDFNARERAGRGQRYPNRHAGRTRRR